LFEPGYIGTFNVLYIRPAGPGRPRENAPATEYTLNINTVMTTARPRVGKDEMTQSDLMQSRTSRRRRRHVQVRYLLTECSLTHYDTLQC